MSTHPFRQVVISEQELRTTVGHPAELALRKQLPELDVHCRDKGDVPGFVLVLDDRHLAIPDRPGNRRLDGMKNLLENPHVGLIFLIPGKEETLRINGRAWIVRDEELLERMTVTGKRPQLAIGVEVEECFFHCAKAFKRSRLWQPAEWSDGSGLAPAAQVFLDHAKPAGATVADVERRLQESYTKRLY